MSRCLIIFAFALWSCGYNDFGGIALPQYEYVAANADIGDVVSLYKGTPFVEDRDIILAGYVTANDAGNNFYRTFIIQDPTGAVEVRAGMFSLHNIFYRGRNVAVKARGLTVGAYNGVLQIGTASAVNSSQPAYIANRYTPGGCLCPQEFSDNVAAVPLDINRLTAEHCGMVVCVSGLSAAAEDAGLRWAENRYNTYRFFEDDAGRRIAVLTSGYADFASEKVPDGKIALTGILMYGQTGKGTMFFLKLRDLNDISNL